MLHEIKKYRNRRGLSRRALAQLAGVSDRTIRNYEVDLHSPKLTDLKKISDALGLPAADLLSAELRQSHRAA